MDPLPSASMMPHTEGKPTKRRRTSDSSDTAVEPWSHEEDKLIMNMVAQHGRRWSLIATYLPWRTDNGVRNRWDRLERADKMRSEHGYRCRRCGQLKRGHVCLGISSRPLPSPQQPSPSGGSPTPSTPERSSLIALAQASASASGRFPDEEPVDWQAADASPLGSPASHSNSISHTPSRSPTPPMVAQDVIALPPCPPLPSPYLTATRPSSAPAAAEEISCDSLTKKRSSHRRERSYDAANLLLLFARTALGDPNLGVLREVR